MAVVEAMAAVGKTAWWTGIRTFCPELEGDGEVLQCASDRGLAPFQDARRTGGLEFGGLIRPALLGMKEG